MKTLKYISHCVMLGALVLNSCGKGDNKDNNKGNTENLLLSPAEQITAEWSGIYRSMSNNEPSSEPLAAQATFSDDQQFQISLEQDESAKVIGTWSEFQGKTLILKITGSTMSSIGATGKIVEANFDVVGETLRVYSANFDLRLKRKSASTPSDNQSGGLTNFFMAYWSCTDGVGRKSKVVIDDKWHFKLSSIRPQERAFVAEGEVKQSTTDSVQLSISSSSDAVSPNSFFELRRNSSMTQLLFVRRDSAPQNLGNCRK